MAIEKVLLIGIAIAILVAGGIFAKNSLKGVSDLTNNDYRTQINTIISDAGSYGFK